MADSIGARMSRAIRAFRSKPDVATGGAIREAARINARTDVPDDERQDIDQQATVQAAKHAGSAVMNLQDLQEFVELAKAGGLNNNELNTTAPVIPRRAVAMADIDFHRLGPNPMMLSRPTGLDFWQLRNLPRRIVPLEGVISTRIREVQRWTKPSDKEWKPGFRLNWKDGRDVTDEDKKYFKTIEAFLLNCGATTDALTRKMMKRPTLWNFVAEHMRDSLTGDHAPIELIRSISGRTHGFIPVDMARVFLTDPRAGADPNTSFDAQLERLGISIPNPEEIIAILATDGRPDAPYTHKNLLLPIRNPSSDQRQYGYGQPEPEMLLKILSAFANALELNMRGITHNSYPPGILLMFGDYSNDDKIALKTTIRSLVDGVTNRFRMPVMFSETQGAGGEFVRIQEPPEEVMYSRWITLQVTCITMLYGMNPERINFDAYRTSPGTSLSGSDTEDRLASEQDSALWPLITWLMQTFQDVIDTLDPTVGIEALGLDPDQAASKAEETNTLTWGEYRQRRGETIPDDEDLANAPLNPTIMQLYMTKLQTKQQQEMQAQQAAAGQQPGAPGQPQPGSDPNATMQDQSGAQWQPDPNQQQEQYPGGHGDLDEAQQQMAKAAQTILELEQWP